MRPYFQSIIDRQALAHYRLNVDRNTHRTPAERANMERNLQPVPLSDAELPKLPLVRLKVSNGEEPMKLVLFGAIAQTPSMVLVFNMTTNTITPYEVDKLEFVPPG